MDQELLRLENLSKYYTSPQAVVVGVNSVNLSFRRGEFVAITGESGSGKSTLSQVLGGILPYESGEMLLRGKPTSHYDSLDWQRYRRDEISFISQNYGILPGVTVQDNVIAALRLSGMDKQQAKAASRPILEQVELWPLRRRRAARLSSGQKQRLAIARALAKPAPILIADEPTGNLDPENSAKVMELLALAARDRLVLLVTHEFPEAAPYATRHIVLHDGKITMDAALRPAAEPAQLERSAAAKKQSLSGFVSRLQLAGRPVWMSLMTGFLALSAFAVFAFLGTFILHLDDTSTRIYDTTTFPNGDKNRIVVTTQTGEPMTRTDYEAILGVDYAVQLETNGYLPDVQYAYREGVDFDVLHHEQVSGDGSHYYTTSYQIRSNAPFLQTIPLLARGAVELEGAAPESFFQVAASRSTGLQVGDRVQVFLTSPGLWGKNVKLQLRFTVSGVTDYGTGLYFHNDVGRMFQQIVWGNNGTDFYYFIPDDLQANRETLAQLRQTDPDAWPEEDALDLAPGQFRAHANWLTQKDGWDGALRSRFENSNDPLSPVELELPLVLLPGGANRCTMYELTRLFQVSQETFDQLTWNRASEQVSLTIRDYAYTDRVLSSLEALGYSAMSPYRFGSARVDEEKAAERVQTLTVCLGALVAVAVLQLVVLWAMFSAQTENYRLLSNLGLVRSTARKSILWQVLLFTLAGQVLGGTGVWLCGNLGVQRIAMLLRYLPAGNVALLCLVHLAMALVGAVFVIRVLDRQVFPLARTRFDLTLDGEV